MDVLNQCTGMPVEQSTIMIDSPAPKLKVQPMQFAFEPRLTAQCYLAGDLSIYAIESHGRSC